MSTRRLLPLFFTIFLEPEAAGAQRYIIEAVSWLTANWGYESLRAGRNSHARHSCPGAGGRARHPAFWRHGANPAAAARLSHRQDPSARRPPRAERIEQRAAPPRTRL